jgi:hypothetical protein
MAKLEGSVQNTNRLSLQQELKIHTVRRDGKELEIIMSSAGYGLALALSSHEADQIQEALRIMRLQPSILNVMITPDLTKESGPG